MMIDLDGFADDAQSVQGVIHEHMIAVRRSKRREQIRKRINRLIAVAVWGGLAVVVSPAVGAESGEELFVKNCAPCHGKDGKAQNPAARKLGVKDLSQSKLADAEIEKQLIEGRKDDRGNQRMPSFKDSLSAEDIKSLITVVKKFRK